jgi:hypothetical protein
MQRQLASFSSPHTIAYFEKNCLISTKYDMTVLISPPPTHQKDFQNFFSFPARSQNLRNAACSYVISFTRRSVHM